MIVKIFNQDLSLYQNIKHLLKYNNRYYWWRCVWKYGRMPMKYKFTGTKINDYDKPKLTYCYCEHKSGLVGKSHLIVVKIKLNLMKMMNKA